MTQDVFKFRRKYEISDSASKTKLPEDFADRVLSVLADEIGCDVSELTDTTLFSDLGVDSLLSLAILGKLRELLDLDVGSTLFIDHPSVKSLRRYLNDVLAPAISPPPDTSSSTPASSQTSNSSPLTTNFMPYEYDSAATIPISQEYPATVTRDNSGRQNMTYLPVTSDSQHSHFRSQSILLQGSPKTARRNIFLLPDGSGSATSYALLPPLSPDICVWGLNCPFMTMPEKFTTGVTAIVRIYLAEIRTRQYHGPYILGG